MSFWKTYFKKVQPSLGARKETFGQIFEYLDGCIGYKCPVIVETGTYREENNYTGDGCSTLLFDNYAKAHDGTVISIDIDPEACKLSRENTGKNTEVICGDSVEELGALTGRADLLYLDSYNIENWFEDWAPAAHHLKELFAAKSIIKPGTLIVVDDNVKSKDGRRLGKGRLVYEIMDALNIIPLFDEYQIGWIWKEDT
jgi:hypothetical protein